MSQNTKKRKVRADFEKRKDYSVDVSNCTEDDKKKVQQAFFDAGFLWDFGGKTYKHLEAKLYTNTTSAGVVTTNLMFSGNAEGCNMTAEEFLALVYEPEQQSHPHAELMALFAEDAKTTAEPWELWQVKDKYMENVWFDLTGFPNWYEHLSFRRKPKTHTVNGVEIPDLRVTPSDNQYFYKPEPYARALVAKTTLTRKSRSGEDMIRHNLCYEYTEAGKQAAILHTKAWLGIA